MIDFNNILKKYDNRFYGVPWAGGGGYNFNQAHRFGAVGGWKELARTTLGSAGDNIDVTGLADKRYYMFLTSGLATGDVNPLMRVGNGSYDTGNNYSERISLNGAETTQVSQPKINFGFSQTTSFNDFTVGYIANLSAKEKLFISHTCFETAAGAGTAVTRSEYTAKWVNTSNVINQIRHFNAEVGSYDTNSELVILGWDAADTHTDNFWEQLASVDFSSGGSISSGVFTSKKYLLIQAYLESDGTGGYDRIKCGKTTIDTASNYSGRYSIDGQADATQVSSADNFFPRDGGGSANFRVFTNVFIVNVSAEEKLFIGSSAYENTAGAGATPRRTEWVMKWTNTSDQIDIVDFDRSAGNYQSPTTLRIWGSD